MFIKFTSHRSRDTAKDILGDLGQGYYSLKRETGKGVYDLSPKQIARIDGQHLVHFTALRGPYDDLLLCWSD
jgi:hypothetical protein